MHRKSSPFLWRLSKENYRLISQENVSGSVESFTIAHAAPKGFEDKAPYIIAVIELNNKEKIVSEIVDCKNVSIGDKVEPCIRKIYADDDAGIIIYGTKFRVKK